MPRIDVVGLDADDTLWHNEMFFRDTQDRFRELLSDHGEPDHIDARLFATEQRNLKQFGYGVKGFTLSLIETAIDLTDGAVGIDDIQTIIGWGREMLDHPLELLPGVADAIDVLRERVRLLIITKGDLMHQESKVARSGLADVVEGVEIVSEKDEDTYRAILERRAIPPEQFLMVGNSLRSDVLPVLAIGGHAAHIPFEVTWVFDQVDADPNRDGYHPLQQLGDVPALLDRFASSD